MLRQSLLLCLGACLGAQPGLGQGFLASPTSWAVPVGGLLQGPINHSFLGLSGGTPGGYSAGTQGYSTLDINGDGRLDLIITTEQQSNGDFVVPGTTPNRYWKVFLGASTGFATTASNWALPVGGVITNTGNQGFTTLTNGTGSGNATGTQAWTTLDINGDQRPDLVVTTEQQPNGTFVVPGSGTNRYWKVFLNTGTGFAATATNWALPVGGLVSSTGNQSFNALTNGMNFGNATGTQAWNTVDINGDGALDIVVSAEQQPNGDFQVPGTNPNRYWKVFLGTGTGFASTATNWTLPAGGRLSVNGSLSFLGFSNGREQGYLPGTQTWSTFDINGDARPDLVVILEQQRNDEFEVPGTDPNRYWKVFLGTGTGFAPTAINWALPVGGFLRSPVSGSFISLTGGINQDYDPGSQTWNTLDINGDRRPDIVVTMEQQPNGTYALPGTSPNRYWKVYLNTGTAFAATATSWPLPLGGIVSGATNSGFNSLQAGTPSFYAVGSLTWNTLDLNGDGALDLVVHAEKQSNGYYRVFGTDPDRYWKVYLGSSTITATAAATAEALALYPNPATEQLHLTGLPDLPTDYVMLSALGQPMRAGQLAHPGASSLEVQQLPPGLYLLQLRQAGSSRTLRFLKQ